MNIIVYWKQFIGIVNNGLTSRYFIRVYLFYLCARTTKKTCEVNSITTRCHGTTYFPPVGGHRQLNTALFVCRRMFCFVASTMFIRIGSQIFTGARGQSWSYLLLNLKRTYVLSLSHWNCAFDSIVYPFLTAIKEGMYKRDVHRSVHHNINLIEITNKMRPCSRIYYSNVS